MRALREDRPDLADEPPALSVRHLGKSYPGFTLDDLSFEVGRGRIAGLIGRNGAGKSTAIKGILRFISARGEVSVFGQEIALREREVKQMIGYVGGGFRFYPLKPLAAVRRAYARFYPRWDPAKYAACLSRFGLDEGKKVRELSEGMKVKFALALALSQGAKLLIMDEPTSGLDPLSREEFCDIVLDLVRREGITVLFSTHITSDLERIADDILYLFRGKLLADCPLKVWQSRYWLARFPSPERAAACSAIGVKPVREGFEGLLLRENLADPPPFPVFEPSLDALMIHLEREQENGL